MNDYPGKLTKPRLLIAEGDAEARASLAGELSACFEVVGLAEDADQAVALAVSERPEVALIDAHMTGGGGVYATREMARLCPGVAICALFTDELEHEVIDILLAGAITYIRRASPPAYLERTLLECLHAQPALVA